MDAVTTAPIPLNDPRPDPNWLPPTPRPSVDEQRVVPPHPVAAARLLLDGVTVRAADGTVLLDDVSMRAGEGELVAIVGASGAGKSTLLDVLAGRVPPTSGRALVEGFDAHMLDAAQRRRVGLVPQTDVLIEDLPLGRMLEYAARLRLPRDRDRNRFRAAARRVLSQVELDGVADVTVKELSGGQRRRASLAVELITSPQLCLLDEPTSGLDPETADTVVAELRALADGGRTVVFVTHNPNDLRRCDRIIALAPGGRVAFDGPQREATTLVSSNDADEVHRALISGRIVQPSVVPARGLAAAISGRVGVSPPTRARGASRPSRLRQWAALTARTLETVARNRLTLAIMIGSPAMVIAMFAILFQSGVFEPSSPSPTSAIMVAFWVAFGGFFFGLTYGLLQICPEAATMQRERAAGVSPGLQILAKLTALAPILVVIDAMMLVVLAWLDRLPPADLATYGRIGVTLALDALAALALGLLASALVRNPAQASLALPMLCFPAVLFSGAILPVPVMAPVGRAISAIMPDRWAFELIGRDLGLRSLFAGDPSPLGPALLAEYRDTWTASHLQIWTTLVVFIVVLAVAAWIALAMRLRRSDRSLDVSSSRQARPVTAQPVRA